MTPTPEERAYAFVESYAVGVDRNTLGFDAWEFKKWLVACIQDAISDEREACARIAEAYDNGGYDPEGKHEIAADIRARGEKK